MRRLIASEFVTLDGVMEAPGHEQHPDGKNAWALQYAGEDQQRFKVDELCVRFARLCRPAGSPWRVGTIRRLGRMSGSRAATSLAQQ